MRADLLESRACVDWAVSQFPSFDARIANWLDANLYVTIENTPDPATHDLLVALEKEPFPLSFNVEFGAYLNTLRSSLDILAVSIARRHNITSLDDVYFPVAANESAFRAGNYKGKHFINSLPQTERTIFESCKPYAGGNDQLFLLHKLDIKRKHRNLLRVCIFTRGFSVSSGVPGNSFTPTVESWVSVNNKTVLGRLVKGMEWPCHDVKLTSLVTTTEPSSFQHRAVIETLHDFARLAESIIGLFDR